MWLITALLFVATLAVYIWFSHQRMMQRFVLRGVDFIQPVPFVGNLSRLIFLRESYMGVFKDTYDLFKHKGMYGFFDMSVPVLNVCDPELIKQITVKDFDHFVDHRKYLPHSASEPLMAKSLFFLTGDRWREMRTTLTPAFTGNKIRKMFHLVVQCSRNYTDILSRENSAKAPFEIEMKDLTLRYSIDVIASTAFGIKTDSLGERNNFFFEMARQSIDLNTRCNQVKLVLMNMFPKLTALMGLRVLTRAQHTFYDRMVHDTIRLREEHGIVRPDMVQLLIEARRGSVEFDADRSRADERMDEEGFACIDEMGSEDLRGIQKTCWDDDDVTAQCYLFLFAGSENTSTLLSFTLYELMVNQAVQERLVAELDEAKGRLNGEAVTYDVLTRLRYLDMVISETLRKWPPTGFLDRQCTKDYTMPTPDGGTIDIPKGTTIWVPVYAMHHDPDLYPDPETYDPERFSLERRHTIQPFTFLPLGAGPRNCIGSRYVLMKTKAFLFDLLTTFSVEGGPSSEFPLKLAANGYMWKTKNGIKVQLRRRNI